MNRSKIVAEVVKVFRDIFDDETLLVTEQTSAVDIEDWDSLEQINLLVAIEKLFMIKFSVSDIENLANVGQTIDLIERKLSANKSE